MICRNVATEGAVLLKNENKVLPLKSGSTVAVFGRNFYYSLKGGAGSGDILGVFPVNTSDTWGRLEDYPTHKNFQEPEIPYEEGIYVGYRYFDSFGVEPIYPFGFGLSYTDFEIRVKSVDLKGGLVEIEAEVENIGDTAGKEVIQVYLSEPDGKMPKAYQQLAAFCKTEVIKPKISKKIKLCFDICDFACYDEENAEFVLEKSDYFVRVGNYSRNTHIVAKITLDENAVTFKTVNRAVPQRQLDLISPKGRKPYTYKGEEQEKANCKALVLRKSGISAKREAAKSSLSVNCKIYCI